MDLPSCAVLDRSSATNAGVQRMVALTRGGTQLYSLCLCKRFFGLSAVWQYQVPGRILTFCRSFCRRAIVLSCRVPTTRCTLADKFFETSRLTITRLAACFVFYGKISRTRFWIFATRFARLGCWATGAQSRLVADIVAKVENRTTLKISRKLIFGLLYRCVAFQRHYGDTDGACCSFGSEHGRDKG